MDEQICTTTLLPKRDGTYDAALQATIVRNAPLLREDPALHKPALFTGMTGSIQRAAGSYRQARANTFPPDQIAIDKAFDSIDGLRRRMPRLKARS